MSTPMRFRGRPKKNNSLLPAVSLLAVMTSLFVGMYIYNTVQEVKANKAELRRVATKELIKREINQAFHMPALEWPQDLKIDGNLYQVHYTFNEELTDYIKRLLLHFRSDYSTVVVIDNETGAILAAVGHERESNEFNKNLAFSSTHPAASLAKIVASADLIERGLVDRNTTFRHRGRGTTLFRSQLENSNSGRAISFGRAFAFSNNVVFGQAAIQKSNEKHLFNMAREFGFNQTLMQDIDLSQSKIGVADSSFNLAELASGFNRETMVSPIHAAVMSSVIANDGEMLRPFVVDRVIDQEGEVFWQLETEKRRILGVDSTEELDSLMRMTVTTGTGRRDFNVMRHGLKPKLRIGGKTGSITGGIPFGRRDWFTAYAVPKDSRFGKGISVAVMNINLEKWYVRSTHLTKRVIEYYFHNIHPLNESNQAITPLAASTE